MIEIEVGSKEEVALLLALFGTSGLPVRKPKPEASSTPSAKPRDGR
jgi:hypothetical protein